MSSQPVFFDESGARRVWVKRLGLLAATVFTVAMTLFVLSLLAIPFVGASKDSLGARVAKLLPRVAQARRGAPARAVRARARRVTTRSQPRKKRGQCDYARAVHRAIRLGCADCGGVLCALAIHRIGLVARAGAAFDARYPDVAVAQPKRRRPRFDRFQLRAKPRQPRGDSDRAAQPRRHLPVAFQRARRLVRRGARASFARFARRANPTYRRAEPVADGK